MNLPNDATNDATTDARVLTIDQLHFAYPGEPALIDHWSGSIGPGVTLLHGDTGSGKTTLLQLLAGVLQGSGLLMLAGARLDPNANLKDHASAYRRQVFFGDPTTPAHDALPARACMTLLSAGDAGFSPTRWQALVEGFALAPHLDKPIYMLSTGTRRKVWLAAALASGRALVLLDEPTGGLDAGSRECLWSALRDAAQRAIASPQTATLVVVASAERIDQVPLAATLELPLNTPLR